MRELKAESQSIKVTQVQPGLKNSSTPQTVDGASEESSLVKIDLSPTSEETPLKRGRRGTPKQAVAKTKRSTTPKAKVASTQVKLTWEPPPLSIAGRFQQLEHELQQLKTHAEQISQQSVEIQTEMEALRTIAHGVTQQVTPQPCQPTYAGPSMPSFMRSSAQQTSSAPQAASPTPEMRKPPEQPPEESAIAAVRSLKTLSSQSLPASAARLRPRRRSVRSLVRQLTPSLKLPKQPIAIAIDALLWILAAAGLRIGLRSLVASLPVLMIPANLLIFLPAIAAAYLAIFVPRSSPVMIYRLLLVTLGLFVGGKL